MIGRSALLLVVLIAASAAALGQARAPDTIVEPQSGTPFPIWLTPPGGTTPHWITGTAIRRRTIFKVKIYAFGLYVDPEGARSALSRFAGLPAAALARDERFYQRLLDLDVAMTLRLVMTRTVDGDAVAETFDEALKPRLERAGIGRGGAGGREALDRFRSYFEVDQVRTGTEIVFSCGPAGRLTASVAADERPPIDSPALCRALFDVYLGENPISEEGKRRAIARFPGLLGTSGTDEPFLPRRTHH
ncbi:MAG: chalcone isomerase family protein [Gemmatimonadetes bacterium]|nr:chalcone isomerase family protein [Gemmatimonadota bacterium]